MAHVLPRSLPTPHPPVFLLILTYVWTPFQILLKGTDPFCSEYRTNFRRTVLVGIIPDMWSVFSISLAPGSGRAAWPPTPFSLPVEDFLL